MGKYWAQASSVTKMAVVIGVLGLLYYFFGGGSTTTGKKMVVKHAASSPAEGASEITAQDLNAHFAVLDATSKDSFKPLVARANGQTGSASDKANGIPGYLAGGDGNWIFSGTATVNDVPEALIENATSGDGVFLEQGQHWKDLVVEQITTDTLVLKSGDGEIVSLKLAAPVDAGEVKPVSPANPLQGAIGDLAQTGPTAGLPNGMQITPDTGAGAVLVAPGGGGGAFRGRGGRGRGGGRGNFQRNFGG